MRIAPNRIEIDFVGKHSRRLVLHLTDGETVAKIRENPAAFTAVQADHNRRLLRGDRLTIITDDSMTIAEGFVVTKANGEGVWFSAPARIINLEPEVLYQSETYEVVPHGSRYSVRDRRSGHVDGVLYDSARAAEFAIMKRGVKTTA